MKQKKWIAGLGLGVAIVAGSLLLATVSPIGLAGAQDESDTDQEDAESGEPAQDRKGRHDVLGEVLDELVADGTIDRADADAVEEAVQARRDEIRAAHPGRPGRNLDPEQRLDEAQDRLDEAIADGSISEPRADRIQDRIDQVRERVANGEPVFPGRGRGWGRHGPPGDDDRE